MYCQIHIIRIFSCNYVIYNESQPSGLYYAKYKISILVSEPTIHLISLYRNGETLFPTLLVSFQRVSLQFPIISAPVKSSTIATAISCKLTRTNFLLWKAQVIPILRGVQLFGHLDGTTPAPPEKVVTEPNTAEKEATEPAKTSPNPDYQTWVIQDQAVIGGLLSSITEEVLPQLIRCTSTAHQLWTSLHTMFSAQHHGNSI